jgi:(p)ppGpp synthase/HD superfamily hydrolase
MLQDLYQKAAKYAAEKHANQLVPGITANYMLHVSNVTMEIILAHKHNPDFDLNLAMLIALLHDTLEDTDASYTEVETFFGDKVATGVQALTKNGELATKEEKMNDSLTRLKASFKEARLVKIADRITNLQQPPAHWSKDKLAKCAKEAVHIADVLRGENEYLDSRILAKIKEYKGYTN